MLTILRHRWLRLLVFAGLPTLIVVGLRSFIVAAPKESAIGGPAESSFLALHDSSKYAWQVFLAISRQADPVRRGEPDSRKKSIRDYDEDTPVVWESWAMVSGGRMGPLRNVPNTSEIFLDRGAMPVAWEDLPRVTKSVEPIAVKQLASLMDQFHSYPELIQVRNGTLETLQPGTPSLTFDPKLNPPNEADEIRMNRIAYEHLREHTLYNIEGLEQIIRSGEQIYFPLGAQEVKAIWTRIDERDKPRYHWRTIDRAGKKELYGLTDLHIMTHDLPNWFWANFVHVDYADRPPGAAANSGEADLNPETKGTKWAYYRLGGTQTSFTDSLGNPTMLSGTQLERNFRGSSSCITCHSRATVGLRSSLPDLPQNRPFTLPVFLAIRPNVVGAVGAPDPKWFVDQDGKKTFVQTDFVFTLPVRALSTADLPPASVPNAEISSQPSAPKASRRP